MSWPLASHFSAMLQNPRAAFRDPKLQSAGRKGRQNQPRPWAGAFAVVYKASVRRTSVPCPAGVHQRIAGTPRALRPDQRLHEGSPAPLPGRIRVSRPEHPLGRGRQVVSADPYGLGARRDPVSVGPDAMPGRRRRRDRLDRRPLDRRGQGTGRRVDRPRRSATRQRHGRIGRRVEAGRLRLAVRAAAGRPAKPGSGRPALPAPRTGRQDAVVARLGPLLGAVDLRGVAGAAAERGFG